MLDLEQPEPQRLFFQSTPNPRSKQTMDFGESSTNIKATAPRVSLSRCEPALQSFYEHDEEREEEEHQGSFQTS
jgi:hypothetical protein